MDKNKSRTEMLAAGRKRLQQFRQKKDNKSGSSHGKSSKKPSKPEQHDSDADVASSTSEPTGLAQVLEGEVVSHAESDLGTIDSSVVHPGENFVTSDVDVAAINLSSTPMPPETGTAETSLAHNAEMCTPELGVFETAINSLEPSKGESAQTIDDELMRVIPLGVSDAPYSEGITQQLGLSVSEDVVVHSPISKHGVEATIETGSTSREEGQESMSSLREDQEADGLGSKQFCRTHDIELQGGGRCGGEIAETVEALALEKTFVEEMAPQSNQVDGVDDVSASASVTCSQEGFMASPLGVSEADETLGMIHEVTNQQGKIVNVHPSNEEKSEMQSVPAHCANNSEGGDQVDSLVAQASDQQYMPEESFIFVDKNNEGTLLTKPDNSSESIIMSPHGDACPINLPQLIEVMKGLSEHDYRLLFTLGGLDSKAELGTSGLILPQHGLRCLLDRLKEELFITSCAKDILHSQLSEQSDLQTEYDRRFCQLDDEISMLRSSLKDAHEGSGQLAEELAECRSELLVTLSGREELQHQFHAAKAEAEEFSARAYELQNSLERSQMDFLSVSKELTDCKNFVAAMQVENEKLNLTLASLTEESQKIMEEKDSCLCEKEKLLNEIADCKNLLAALQVECSNLKGNLNSVVEERKKLEGDKEHLAQANENVSRELSDCKGGMSALQVENGNLNENLALVIEEREKIKQENECLSAELLSLHGRLSEDDRERIRLEIELKEVTMRLEQLTEENIFLNSSLDVHKAKIREFDNRQAQSGFTKTVTGDKGVLQIPAKQDGEVTFCRQEKAMPGGGPPAKLYEQDVLDDTRFVVLKGRMKEVEQTLEKLERGIERMHSDSASISRSGDKVAAPAVSKLIQAFETKVQHSEVDAEERDIAEDLSLAAESFGATKSHAENLKSVLLQLALEVENVSSAFVAERDGRSSANLRVLELNNQFSILKKHNDELEATNIELGVLYEAAMQHAFDVKEKNGELEVLYETLKQQNDSLKAGNCELVEKLGACESRVNELQSQLHGFQSSSDERASVLRDQLEHFQKEASERVQTIEKEWGSTVTLIVEAVERLDSSVGFVPNSDISVGSCDSLYIGSRVAASVNAAIKLVEDLKNKLHIVCRDHEENSNLFNEVNGKCNELLVKNELACGTLHQLYCKLRKLVSDSRASVEEYEINMQDEEMPASVNYDRYKTLMEQLENLLAERLQLQSVNDKLNIELMSKMKDFEELGSRCIDLSSIQNLITDLEGVVKLEDAGTGQMPLSHLEALVSLLVSKYKEMDRQLSSSREDFEAKVMENEIFLKERVNKAEEALFATRSELQEKVSELEQSEQRVSSVREKLSIAVAKGKGLIVQRDSLKQSLAETSSELERCSHELQLKDAQIHELEAKLKTYSEAGERVEALESELSYIRNSATALRESFLIKDSVLQGIEEILADLDLPEHFHSRDIIEKVDWLARSVSGNALPPNNWDQNNSMAGSYSDAGFVVMDAWKEDAQPSSNSGDDFRRKHEELQNKFYALAEQNEMLEQSLMERNNLVQRWEEILDRINMPSHLRSVEPEDRIQWLQNALLEANQDRDSLLQKTYELERHCESLTADLEDSGMRISDLNAELEEFKKRISVFEIDFQEVIHEKDNLSERLEIVTGDHEKLSAKAVRFELDNEKLQNEVAGLQETLAQKIENEEQIQRINDQISRMQDLVSDMLQDPSAKDSISVGSGTELLEGLLKRLIENYRTLSLMKPVHGDEGHCIEAADKDLDEGRMGDKLDTEGSDVALLKRCTPDSKEPNADVLKKELDEALHELIYVKEDRDRYMEKHQSLVYEVEALDRKRLELQELLNQEEQKSNSLREKLNVAVRKGKSLVQQRDSLKQTIEDMNAELEHLRSEIKHQENDLLNYEQKMRETTIYTERVEALESESLLLRNHLAETELSLQEKGLMLTRIVDALGEIDVGDESNTNDPVRNVEVIGKLCRDLHSAMVSSEEESRKSRRAAELLLAELNEVQDRNDSLQEELAQATTELVELSKQRDMAEAMKLEALSHLEKLSAVHSEEKRKQYSHFVALKSLVNQLRRSFPDIIDLLDDAFSKDLEFLQNLEVAIDTCLKRKEADDAVNVPSFCVAESITSSKLKDKENFRSIDISAEADMTDHFDDNFISNACTSMEEFILEIGALKVMLHEHSVRLQGQASNISKSMRILHIEMTSQNESYEGLKRDIKHIESVEKEKEMEITRLRKNIGLLYEACTSSLVELENRKLEVVESSLAAGDMKFSATPTMLDDGRLLSGGENSLSEEHIKNVSERLLLGMKDFASLKGELVESNKNEMKITISNLQKELQEKDIQRERICMELVSQIKEAEAAVARYSVELQSSNTRVHDLQKQVEMMEEERSLLEQRVKELQDGQAVLTDLQEKVRSMTNILAAKDQEIEALMQALEEEEVQMEDLTKKVEELEKLVEQKNSDVQNLESSRGKVLKKLSVTVSRFDELHHFSESLLTEVEKLQLQLQDRDAEISFLRQEVTRCTNDVIVASQMSNKQNSDGIHELLTWLHALIPQDSMQDMNLDDNSQANKYKDTLQKKITSILSELEDLRVVTQNRDALLEMERRKVEELTSREQILMRSLHEKESQLSMLESVGGSRQPTAAASEILEVEPVINKWTVPGPSTTSQVRSLRKVNNDQVAIAIDMDAGDSGRLEDEDDDKVHGFKSLTTSRIVPKFTRPVTDMIDGLWVSCDRTLMRQPALRLGIIIYWAVLHALLATFVV